MPDSLYIVYSVQYTLQYTVTLYNAWKHIFHMPDSLYNSMELYIQLLQLVTEVITLQ